MMETSLVLPRRQVGLRTALLLLLTPPAALLVLPRNERTVFAAAIAWLLISLPVAIVALTDWSHGSEQRWRLAAAFGRTPARLLAAAASLLGLISPLRVALAPRPGQSLSGAIAFGFMMAVLGRGLWRYATISSTEPYRR